MKYIIWTMFNKKVILTVPDIAARLRKLAGKDPASTAIQELTVISSFLFLTKRERDAKLKPMQKLADTMRRRGLLVYVWEGSFSEKAKTNNGRRR